MFDPLLQPIFWFLRLPLAEVLQRKAENFALREVPENYFVGSILRIIERISEFGMHELLDLVEFCTHPLTLQSCSVCGELFLPFLSGQFLDTNGSRKQRSYSLLPFWIVNEKAHGGHALSVC
jgi:hypothetical protein